MARVLGAELSGNILFISNSLYFFLLIGSLSLDSGIIYYVVKKGIPERILASASVLWALIIAALMGSGIFIFYNSTHLFSSAFLLFASLAYTSGSLLIIYFTAFFYGHNDYKMPNLILGIFNLMLLIFIPWKTNWLGFVDNEIFAWLFFATFLIQGSYMAFLHFIKNNQRFSLKIKSNAFKSIRPAIQYSLATLLGNVAYFLLYRIDYWFVAFYCSSKSLGNYIQVSRLGQLFLLFPIMIASTLFPQFSKDQPDFNMKDIGKLAKQLIIIYLLLTVSVLLIGRSVILWLWGVEYDEMFIPLVLIMPGILFLAISYLFSSIFAGMGKIKYNVVIAIITLIIVIICDCFFIPAWGIDGAAIATSAGFFVMLILYLFLAKKRLGFSLIHLT